MGTVNASFDIYRLTKTSLRSWKAWRLFGVVSHRITPGIFAIGSKIGSTPSPAKCSQPKYRTKPHFGRAFCIYWTPRQQRISESWYR